MKKNSTEQQELSIVQQNAELLIIGKKICTKCKQEKLTSDFYKSRQRSFQSQCKKCKREGKRKTERAFLSDAVPLGEAACSHCKKTKPKTEEFFHASRLAFSNRKMIVCKICSNKRTIKYSKRNPEKSRARHEAWRFKNKGHVRHLSRLRKSMVKRATPNWFEFEMVKKIYDMSFVYGFDVDHIVPITSKLVCGLHCHANLQLLHKSINSSKKNLYWPDMP